MRTASIFAIAMILVVGAPGCGKSTPKTTVRIPPRIDLTQLEVIGVVEFDSSSERELAIARDAELHGRSQARSGTGPHRRTGLEIRSAGIGRPGSSWNTGTIRALGNEHGVATILTGKLTISEARPSISIAPSLESGSVSALIKATLAVQLIEVSSGASIWSSSASASRDVGNISVYGGKDVVVNARDPKGVYGPLVDSLVEQVTRDFKATWVRR